MASFIWKPILLLFTCIIMGSTTTTTIAAAATALDTALPLVPLHVEIDDNIFPSIVLRDGDSMDSFQEALDSQLPYSVPSKDVLPFIQLTGLNVLQIFPY